MVDTLAKIEVTTPSETLTVLDTNTLVDILTERLAQMEVNPVGNIFFECGH